MTSLGDPKPSFLTQEEMSQRAQLYAAIGTAFQEKREPDPVELAGRFPGLANSIASAIRVLRALEQVVPSVSLAAASMTPRLPRRLGDYELLAELGRGGMGVVYLARSVGLEADRAVKVIDTRRVGDREMQERFRREAQILAHTNHSNIVPIHSVGEADGELYFSMDLIQGGSLDKFLPKLRTDLRKSGRLLAKVARAVHHVHQHAVLHRDLKPGNILLDGQDEPFVSDFGLARRLDKESDLTPDSAIIGTPSYMSPEQASGQQATVLSDIYGLGAILYEMLTGTPPFRGSTPLETLHLVVGTTPLPPRQHAPKVPRDLETICLKCLEKEPGKRYDSAAALADDLERWLDGRPIQARPVGTTERVARWCRRNPVVAGLLLLLQFSLLAGLGIAILAALWINHARVEEQAAKDAESKQRQLAEANAEDYRKLFVRLQVANASRMQEEGDLLRSLPWLADALTRDSERPDAEKLQRIRLGTALRQCPTVQGFLFHDGPISSVEFSPNSKQLLTASWDGTARLWRTDTRSAVATLPHRGPVLHAVFSSNGKFVATGCSDGTARVWDAKTGQPSTPPLQLGLPVAHVDISRDGKLVAAGGGHRWQRTTHIMRHMMLPNPARGGALSKVLVPQPVPAVARTRVWEIATGTPATGNLEYHGWVNAVAFHPELPHLVTVGSGRDFQGEGHLWDIATGKRLISLEKSPLIVHSVRWSADGRQLLTAAGSQDRPAGEARVWNATTGMKHGPALEHAQSVIMAAFSPDGKRLLSAGEDRVARVWDASTGKQVGALMPHRDRLTGACFSNDGRQVLTLSWDWTARVWDANAGKALTPPLWHSAPVTCGAFGSDGRLVATADHVGVVRIWDLQQESPAIAVRHETALSAASFTPNGRQVVSTVGRSVDVRLLHSGRSLLTRQVTNTQILVWDMVKNRRLALLPLDSKMEGYLNRLPSLLGNGGRQLALIRHSERDEGSVTLYDLETGQPCGGPYHFEFPVRATGFDAKGRCLVATETLPGRKVPANVVHVWSLESGRKQPVGGPVRLGTNVQFASLSPDGRFLITAEDDFTVSFWNLENGKRESLKLGGHLTLVAYHPSEKRVVLVIGEMSINGARRSDVLLWDLAKSESKTLQRHLDSVTHAEFSPDGKMLVTSSADRTARLWDGQTGNALKAPLLHRDAVEHASFSGDGRWLATASRDGTARVWVAASGEPLTPPMWHAGPVLHTTFHPREQRVVTTCEDGTVRMWDLTPDARGQEELVKRVQIQAGHRIDATGGMEPLEPAALRKLWPPEN